MKVSVFCHNNKLGGLEERAIRTRIVLGYFSTSTFFCLLLVTNQRLDAFASRKFPSRRIPEGFRAVEATCLRTTVSMFVSTHTNTR